jgi:hypothetical protein
MPFEYEDYPPEAAVARILELEEEVVSLKEHIIEDHETLSKLFDYHQSYWSDSGLICEWDGFMWPCSTHRVLVGDD